MRRFPLSLFIYPKLCSFAPAPKNAVHFLYGAAFHRPALLPPLQSVFAKDTAFLSAKAQKLQKAALFAVICRNFMEESCRGFFVSSWLYSTPGRSLCERINLDFATAPGCLHSLRSVDMTVFAMVCRGFRL